MGMYSFRAALVMFERSSERGCWIVVVRGGRDAWMEEVREEMSVPMSRTRS